MFCFDLFEIMFGIVCLKLSTVEVTGSREGGDVRGSPLTSVNGTCKMSNKHAYIM